MSDMPYFVNPSLCSSGLNSRHTVRVFLYICTCVTHRDLESACRVCNGSEVDPRADQTSYRAAVPSGVSSVMYTVLEMRDGNKSKLRDKGILKAVVDIIDDIAHGLLGMNVWEQAEIDRTMLETLGTNNEWCWSTANSSDNGTLAISTTVCRAGATSEVFPCTYISTLTGKPTDRFVMRVFSFSVVSGGSHAGNLLACPEFLIVPTGAGSVPEDMITDTEVFYTLKFGLKRTYGEMRAMLVTRKVLLRVCSSTVKRPIFSPCFLSCSVCLATLRMESRLMNVECLLFVRPKNVQLNSVPKLVVARNVLPHGGIKRAF